MNTEKGNFNNTLGWLLPIFIVVRLANFNCCKFCQYTAQGEDMDIMQLSPE